MKLVLPFWINSISNFMRACCVQDDYIIRRGEPYRELIIVTSGKARSMLEDEEPESPRAGAASPRSVKELDSVIEYTEGSFFGELVRTHAGLSIVCSRSLVRALR